MKKASIIKIYLGYLATGLLVNVMYSFTSVPIPTPTGTGAVNSRKLLSLTPEVPEICIYNQDCGHGKCIQEFNREYPPPNGTRVCECNGGYTTHGYGICNYKESSRIATFCLSLFLGEFGADWFHIARGNSRYNGIGVVKLFTVGGLGIWWIVDFARIAADPCNLKDGNSVCLSSWSY